MKTQFTNAENAELCVLDLGMALVGLARVPDGIARHQIVLLQEAQDILGKVITAAIRRQLSEGSKR